MTTKVIVIGDKVYGNVVKNLRQVDEIVTLQPMRYPDELITFSLLVQTGEVRLVILTGGEDVNPAMYGEKEVHPKTHFDINRDAIDSLVYDVCVASGIPVLGICRGSQFLCVKNGGALIQDVTHHAVAAGHEISYHHFTKEGFSKKGKAQVTSTHHQMVNPNRETADILAYSLEPLSTHYHDGRGNNLVYMGFQEPEIVYYPEHDCVGIQYHPEYMDINSKGFIIAENIAKQLINDSLVKIQDYRD